MRNSVRRGVLGLVLIGAMLMGHESTRADDAEALKANALGSTTNVHTAKSVWLCGQPSADDLQLAKEKGIKVIVTLRGEKEIDWDEQLAAEKLGLTFRRVAFREPASLTDAVFDETRKILQESAQNNQPVMLHCGAANRVGAIWLVHRVLDDGVPLEKAQQEAKEVGLKTEGYVQRALEYIETHRQPAK